MRGEVGKNLSTERVAKTSPARQAAYKQTRPHLEKHLLGRQQQAPREPQNPNLPT